MLLALCIVFLVMQTSMLARFGPFGFTANLIAFVVFFTIITGKRRSPYGLTAALFGGILLDFFSELPFGVWTGGFFSVWVFISLILKSHVQIPFFEKQ